MKLSPSISKFRLLLLAASLVASLFPAVSPAADDIPRMSIQELKAKMDNKEPIVILDVRTSDDYAGSKYMIAGAIRIRVDQLRERYKELPPDREVVAYCS